MVQRKQILFLVGIMIGFAVTGVALNLAGSDGVQINNGVPLGAQDYNNTVVVYGNTNISMEDISPSSGVVNVVTEEGNMTVTAMGSTHVEVQATAITGTETKLTGITAGSTWITANPEDKPPIDFRGDLNKIYFRDIDTSSTNEDFWVSGPDGGVATVRTSDLPANTRIAAYDTNNRTILDTDTTDGNGEGTFNIDLSSHSVSLETFENTAPTLANFGPQDGATIRTPQPTLSVDVDDAEFANGDEVNVTYYVDGTKVKSANITSAQTVTYTASGLNVGSHTYTVRAEDKFGGVTEQTVSFEVELYAPKVTTLQPTGSLDYSPSELSAQINDTEFGKAWGDSVEVAIRLDGSVIDTQTITQNRTVTTTIPSDGLTGGSHTYRFIATDSHNYEDQESASYATPATFYIRNELNHSELVTDPINSTLTFFGGNTVYTRTASDGTVNMTGLPVDQSFLVKVSPTDGNWTERTIYVSNIYEQQSIYLLNTSEVQTVTNRFVLDDSTGRFGSSSVLKIQRTVVINGTQTWRTITADKFGVEGVTTTLEEGVRYRVIVRNEDGYEELVGPYRAEATQQVRVVPSSASIDLPKPVDGIQSNATVKDGTLQYAIATPAVADSITVNVYERGNPDNTLVEDAQFFNTDNVADTITLTKNQTETVWIVEFTVNQNGETTTITHTVSQRPDLFTTLGGNWTTIIGVSLLILLAGAFSILNAAIGAVVVSLVGGILWYIGLLGTAASSIGIVAALLLSAAVYARQASRP